MFIDTHCHLNFPQYDTDQAMVIGNAKKAGVKQFINPGVDLFSSLQAVNLAKKHVGVIFAAVGIHPYEAQHDPDVRELEKIIIETMKKRGNEPSPLVAIGECGLDYHQYSGEQALGKKDKQKRLFAEQLELALKYDLPVIFHCRDGYDDFFDVLDSLPSQPRGVIHCFSGGLQEVRQAQKREFFVGFDGNVTYSKHLQSIIPSIPLSMILLETDSPYLTPAPHRGSRNEPKYIPLIATEIARLHGVSVKKVEEATTANARTLFQIS
ncbi:MAG: TatD family hydrolase [Candidatus Gottesmanbacteria bacterium]|nr:TatD family hydrolase [Candidatus Gottesmanbacteria bacterium]